MENSKFVKIFIPIFILGFFILNIGAVFAYEIETHAFLTDEIIKFYSQNFPNNKIPEDFRNYLIDGSRREDAIPRWMNHFYDPIYNRGLTDFALGTWQKSEDWAQDSNNQNSLTYKVPTTIASILNAIQQKKLSLISDETDFTWQRAVKFYVQGDTEKAMFILGHILHLIEDVSVPDHTRNDPHFGDSPFENWTDRFTLSNPDQGLGQRLNNKKPFIFSDLNSYFNELVKYSNNNFYSKETIGIQSGYKIPEPDYFSRAIDGKMYGMKIDKEFGDYYLIISQPKIILITLKPEELLSSDYIKNDYWSRLSTKSVQYGAGVINLFFQEVKKAKNDPSFAKAEDKSFFAKAIDAVKNLSGQVGSFFSGLFQNNQDFRPARQISLNQSANQEAQSEEVQSPGQTKIDNSQKIQSQNQQAQPQKSQQQIIEADEELQPLQKKQTQLSQQTATTTQQIPKQTETQITPSFKECGFSTNQSPSRSKLIINEVAWMGTSASANDEWIELKNISGGEVDITNWQLIDKGEQIKINLSLLKKTKVAVSEYLLLERTDDNSIPNISADLIYTGVLSNSDEGLQLFDNQCNLIDEVLANSDWPAGDNTSAAERKTMERNSSGFGWHTSSILGGTPKAENSQPIIITSGGGGGGVSASTGGNVNNNTQQASAEIRISEIMYDLVGSDDGREWIEIFNAGSSAANLEGWKFYEDNTNHNLNLIHGSANLEAGGYAIIADDSNKFLQDNPQYTGVLFDSSFSLSNAGESIAIKNGDTVINEVNYNSGQGANGDGNSLQLINNQWVPARPTPDSINQVSQNNEAPSAFFDYSPQNPRIGDLITFNAASSTDSDGNIVLYEWNWGDGATASTTQATTTHSYSAAGNYNIQLVIFDNQNSSSTTASAISVDAASSQGVNHIVISEIMAGNGAGHSNEEFIELYNPTNGDVSLADWSLKRKPSQTSTSTLNLVSEFSATSTIKAKSFFLIAHNDYLDYSTSTQPDFFYTNQSNPLAYDDDVVIFYNGSGDIIDEVYYQNIDSGKSFERKAYSGGNCVSAQNNGEFSGNGCDMDSENDFEIRSAPKPQNSLNFPEPRTNPTAPANFGIQYASSTMELIFNWQPSQDYSGASSDLIYKLISSDGGEDIETASATAKISIDEVGRDYNFSIQAADKDGLSSEMASSTISVPSFFKEFYFYQDLRDAVSPSYILEFAYERYPFLPDAKLSLESAYGAGNNWKALVFYFDQDPIKDEFMYGDSASSSQALLINYYQCNGSHSPFDALILPDTGNECRGSGEFYNRALQPQYLEDNRFLSEEIIIPGGSASSKDYISIAYYGFERAYPPGSDPFFAFNNFRLIAVDKIKYHFQTDPPVHQPPLPPYGFYIESYDSGSQNLALKWERPSDPDSLDSQLGFEISHSTSTNFSFWIPLALQIWESPKANIIAAPGSKFAIRTKDDFGNVSAAKIITLVSGDGDYFLEVGDPQPSPAFKDIILSQQLNDSEPEAATFDATGDYPLSRNFTTVSDGYISKVEFKTHARNSYELQFQLRIKKGEETLGISDNKYTTADVRQLPSPLVFTFSQTPFLVASETYTLVIERLCYGMGNIGFYGAPPMYTGDVYNKIYGLSQ